MPIFRYTVKDAEGTLRSGNSESESEEQLWRRLSDQGFTVESVELRTAERWGCFPPLLFLMLMLAGGSSLFRFCLA